MSDAAESVFDHVTKRYAGRDGLSAECGSWLLLIARAGCRNARGYSAY